MPERETATKHISLLTQYSTKGEINGLSAVRKVASHALFFVDRDLSAMQANWTPPLCRDTYLPAKPRYPLRRRVSVERARPTTGESAAAVPRRSVRPYPETSLTV